MFHKSIIAAAGIALLALVPTVEVQASGDTTMTKTGYADVNGLHMYYEIHGQGGTPLVLIHGAFSAVGTSFGQLLPGLSKDRQVIAFELQGHGHTADIDRPLSPEGMADDVAAALAQLGVTRADVQGYSMGAFVALHVALRHPEVVRKLVFISATYRLDGIQPGLMANLGEMKPEMMQGTPWYEEYMRIAPRPQDFARLFAKKTAMDRATRDIADEAIAAIKSPVLIAIGDADLVQAEHAVKMFRLLGGGGFGDMPPGMPDSQLAILPGTSHVSMASRADLLIPIVTHFLDAPMPKAK